MTIERKLLGTTPVSSGIEPEAVSFVATDYLSKSTLTGQANSKTFTFSAWVYVSSKVTGGNAQIYHVVTNDRFQIYHSRVNNAIYFAGGIVNEGNILTGHTGANSFPLDTWSHFLISVNMASTSQRHVYINDEIPSSMSWETYNNFNIEFNVSGNNVGGDYSTAKPQRLSNVFLDYTYRNLSTTSNRRLFIDADGKPSDTIPSSPIVYLPMTDAATAGSNSGTGGDFTVNGVLATAERGPNQDNCSASTFDGSNDYLSRSSITGLSDSKLFTFSFNASQTSGNAQIFTASNGQVSIKLESRQCTVRLGNSGGAVLYFSSPATVASKLYYGQHNHWCFSCDLSDTSKRHMFLNGVDITSGINFITYTNADADLTHTPNAIGAGATGGDKFTGSIGEFYLDTAYYDLATENPFWDSDTNRPNSVRKVISDTSVTPAIAMPLIGSDAGNNLGTGGDFTVNSGPYVGARGGSEFFARSVDFDANSDWFYRSSLSGVSNSKHFSAVFAFNIDAWTTGKERLFTCHGGSPNRELVTIEIDGSGAGINSRLKNTSNSTIGYIASNQSLSLNQWYVVMLCMDLTDSNKSRIYIDSVNQTLNSNTVVNENIPYTSVNNVWVGNDDAGANNTSDGSFAICYYNNTYIDFSQETTRNMFLDQLGYPKDLTQQIADGDIPNPLVYMKFDPTVSLGTNSGTGGDFSVTATPISGPDVTP